MLEDPPRFTGIGLGGSSLTMGSAVAQKTPEMQPSSPEPPLHDAQAATPSDQHKLVAIFRDSPAAMAVWRGPDLVFEMVNPVYQAIFGDRELVGRPFLEALPEFEGQEFPRLLREVFDTGRPYVGREVPAHLSPRKGAPMEERFYDFTYVRIEDVDGSPYGVYDHALDVTDRVIARRTNEELMRENAILLESERLARSRAEEASRAKDDFLATVSHELRTPLSAIIGWVQLLRTAHFDPEETASALANIEQSAKVQTLLIEDLLDMSRIVAGKLRLNVRPTTVGSFLNAAIETVRPAAAAKGITIESSVIAGDEILDVDGDRMQQVMWNLLSNAIKFTPRGGVVRITVVRNDSVLTTTVTDNGAGISADMLPCIFDRFGQGRSFSSRRHGGLGLGLAIARQLVELHGGTVEARSEGENRGAEFVVTLPLSIGDAP
jgi:signal transduction histidine kinase